MTSGCLACFGRYCNPGSRVGHCGQIMPSLSEQTLGNHFIVNDYFDRHHDFIVQSQDLSSRQVIDNRIRKQDGRRSDDWLPLIFKAKK